MKQKKPSKSSGGGSSAGPDVDQIEELLKIMTEHNVEEIEYSRGGLKIRLKKPSTGVAISAPRMVATPEIIVAGVAPSSSYSPASSAPAPEARSSDDLHLVKSPIVGTFYASPSPGTEPFVKIGGEGGGGATRLIFEDMQHLNESEGGSNGGRLRVYVAQRQAGRYVQAPVRSP